MPTRHIREQSRRKPGRWCHYCGIELRDGIGTWDHIIPAALGGTSAAVNQVRACRPCNAGKGSALRLDHCLICRAAADYWLSRPQQPTHLAAVRAALAAAVSAP